MPADTLKPEDENFVAEEGKIYRETFMFSATMPPAVERLARKCVIVSSSLSLFLSLFALN